MPKAGNYVKDPKTGKFVLYENTNEYKAMNAANFAAKQAYKMAGLGPLAKGMLPRGPSANNLAKAAENAEAAYGAGVAVKYRKSRKGRKAERKSRKVERKSRKASRKANRKSRKNTRRSRK